MSGKIRKGKGEKEKRKEIVENILKWKNISIHIEKAERTEFKCNDKVVFSGFMIGI